MLVIADDCSALDFSWAWAILLMHTELWTPCRLWPASGFCGVQLLSVQPGGWPFMCPQISNHHEYLS